MSLSEDMRKLDSRGFTLVELVVVFAIFFIATTAGMVSFSQYSNSQILDSSSKGVAGFLNNTRSNAVTQILLGSCTGSLLLYSVRFTMPSTYSMWAYCNGTSYLLKSERLPGGVTFDTGTSGEILFTVSTGASTGGGTVRLRGGSTIKIINVDTLGNITGL